MNVAPTRKSAATHASVRRFRGDGLDEKRPGTQQDVNVAFADYHQENQFPTRRGTTFSPSGNCNGPRVSGMLGHEAGARTRRLIGRYITPSRPRTAAARTANGVFWFGLP